MRVIVTEPRAPFPYFGGKRNAVQIVWSALGNPAHYIEPFCGSCAMLLARPKDEIGLETVNDKDGMLVNVWRSIRNAPDEVAHECAIPVMEIELHARLAATKAKMTPDFTAWMEADEKHYDAKLAANWLYCTCASIGECWTDYGPWRRITEADGETYLRKVGKNYDAGRGIRRELPHLGNAGQGIRRKLPHLGNAGQGIRRKLPHLGNAGQGIRRKLPHLGNAGQGDADLMPHEASVRQYLRALALRLERVRICCGDWRRIVSTPTTIFANQSNAGIFFDPPYSVSPDLYVDGVDCSGDVRDWCKKYGGRRNIRIAICGFLNDHDELLAHGWRKADGKAGGAGYNVDKNAAKRERIWFSPYCIDKDLDLFNFKGEEAK